MNLQQVTWCCSMLLGWACTRAHAHDGQQSSWFANLRTSRLRHERRAEDCKLYGMQE